MTTACASSACNLRRPAMVKRLSEQFAWDDAKERRLKGCLDADLTRKQCAERLGTSPGNVSEKMAERGWGRPKIKWTDGPKPSTNPDKWGQL